MRCGAVLVAAGRGERMGFNKTLAPLGGRPVLIHSLEQFASVGEIAEIVVVVSAASSDAVRQLLNETFRGQSIDLCLGGDTRQKSVQNGIAALSPEVDLVLIHDAARPLVTAEMMREGVRTATETGAAIATVPVSDTIKMRSADGSIEGTPERSVLFAAQTPQIFRRDWLEASYRRLNSSNQSVQFTDESSLLEWAGYRVCTFAGSPENIKLTNPVDFAIAEAILRWRGGAAL